jgi:phosphoribosylamine--glycine ligase
MKEKGFPYKGILYAGLMIKNSEPKLIEYNIRFGDPECQVLMMRLKSDLLKIIQSTLNKTLDKINIKWIKEYCITVVAASKGYPEKFEKYKEIKKIGDIKQDSSQQIFQASTIKDKQGRVYSNGGRVLSATVINSSLEDARNRALKMLDNLEWENKYYRRDIGYKVIKK